ncbi:MAG: M3 family oligoendopeptidase [Roseburia sp.]|nr:M3 family oligoendopeptidase [Roseburia sp.]MDY5882628.1 M3 family oligoendopeptidase [Roseburia sp.]
MKFSEMPYERIDMDQVEKKFKDIIERTKNAKSGEEQFAIHKEYYALNDDIQTNMTLAYIRHDIDTTDEFYEKEQNFYDEVMPIINNYETTYGKILYESPYREYLESKIGKVPFKNIELSLKAFDEKLIPLMQEENALVSRYDKLIATAKISFDGEVYNLSLMGKFQRSSDREVRRRAWKAVSDYFLSVTDEIDEIYDKMVKNRTEQAKMLGYENYIELAYYRMGRNCYDKDMVANFRKQVKEFFVPFANKLHEQRRKRIGVEKLSYIDNGVYFTNGNPEPIGTPEEILAAGQKMYSELSPQTKEFFDFMRENELFDVLGRKTKKQGGYMTYLPNYKSPFIFANFNGTSGDVDVITHECGHAFQGYLVRNEEIREVADITMETAEIHSMSMEYFTYGWMDLFFGDRKDDYLTMHLEDASAFVPYGCMVDEFQHIVYAKPEMTPQERKEVWMQLEKEYRPHMDYEDDPFYSKGGFWQRQPHIFQVPFYYIDYCLASVCAMQFKVMMDEDFEKAWNNYYKLCKLSASDFFVNVIKEVGLQNPFEDGCIKELVEKLSAKTFE